MTIQNSHVAFHSQHQLVQKQGQRFSLEFRPLEPLRTEEKESAEPVRGTADYSKRLRYLILQQLLDLFNSISRSISPPNETMRLSPPKRFEQRISVEQKYFESERLDVSMAGKVQTDTMCIDIDIDLSMSRSFVAEHQLELTAQFYDPLVINFNGELPGLSETKFAFDIDNDGTSDQISCLDEGSGFLAFDADENGCIDQGSELFGTLTGNGFKELARHDSDRNGWIDANDPILDKLQIWHKTAEKSELVALGEAGIGAIYLGYTDSPFTFKSDQQESLGRVRSSGFYLFEDGKSGIVSQIDMARTPPTQSDTPLATALATV